MDMFFSLYCQWSEAREVPLSPSMRRSTGELDLAPPLFPSLGPARGEWPGARRASGGVRSWGWRRGCRGGASVGSQAYVVALLQVPIAHGSQKFRFEANLSCHQPQECTVRLGFCFVSGMPTGEARVHGSLLMGKQYLDQVS